MPDYTMLVKINDNINQSLSIEDQERLCPHRGDIVAVRPIDWVWGRLEEKKFLVIPVFNITEEDAEDLASPILIPCRFTDIEINKKLQKESKQIEKTRLPPAEAEMHLKEAEKALRTVHDEIASYRRYKVDLSNLLMAFSNERIQRIYDDEREEQPFTHYQVSKGKVVPKSAQLLEDAKAIIMDKEEIDSEKQRIGKIIAKLQQSFHVPPRAVRRKVQGIK